MKTRPDKGYTVKDSEYYSWKSHIMEYNKKKRILAAPERYRQCRTCKNLYCYLLRKTSKKPRSCSFCFSDEPMPISEGILDILRKYKNVKGIIK